MISEEIIREAAGRLAGKFNPERIILFGSHARGTADDHSDVDFMVLTEAAKEGNRHEIIVEMDRALRGLRIARDIAVLTPDEFEEEKEIPGTTARYALKEGKVLYERKHERNQKARERMVAVR